MSKHLPIPSRIRDGGVATILVVLLLFALLGFFAGDTIKRVVIPGQDHVRVIPGPRVTITERSTPGITTKTNTVTATPRATKTPDTATTVTVPGPTRTRTATRTHTATATVTRWVPGPTQTVRVPVPGPTVTVTLPPLLQVVCIDVLGTRVACPGK